MLNGLGIKSKLIFQIVPMTGFTGSMHSWATLKLKPATNMMSHIPMCYKVRSLETGVEWGRWGTDI